MKYSIIIPSYCNTQEQFNNLVATAKSVYEHSKDYELILVDDGSNFDTEPFGWGIDTYVEYDVFVHHNKNKGIACSWNDGIKLARGEYVAVINDDITVQEGWLEALANALDFDDDYWVAAPGVFGKDTIEQQSGGIVESYQWYPGYCFMMKKETLDSIGLFDEQFSPFNYEDTDMWTRVLQTGAKLVRNYRTTIAHKEGHVLHTLDYEGVSATNKKKFIAKHGFDPIPVFYENKPYDFYSNS